ncbi:hypothetical protein Clacol_006413 [Clathrus columnatus]|uniref:Man1/Src1-like C-terminal domain-containing protein n=1 Tax=Clathrus columnatus TaxID=1419009 RepID=A0AAV5AEL6_9AGAM|nr:hypothetical protein Clacol_006413 [Clathrus columnatus]
MPPRSSTQVIDSGEYLEPGFDANSLTIPHLLSLFTFHQVKYPIPYNKSILVDTFNKQIKPRSEKFKMERLQRQDSIPSSHGITDGLTGKSLSDDEQQVEESAPPPRRSSRRLSKPPSQSVAPPPQKRHRYSAEPALSRVPKSRAQPVEPVLVEESESEEEPVKKVGRPRRSDETEGWSDNNVFQSGAESSSPARPLPKIKSSATTRRLPRRGRTSLSAPPQVPSSSPFSAPSSVNFGPRIPLSNSRQPDRLSFHIKPEPRSSSPIPEAREEDQYADDMVILDESQDPLDDDDESEKALVTEISRTLAKGDPSRRQTIARRSSLPVSTRRILTYVVMITLSVILHSYKTKSVVNGFCDPDQDTNGIIEERKASLNALEECMQHAKNASENHEDVHCDPPPLLRSLEPMTCTPCPAHASCTPTNVSCKESFVIQSHPLAQLPVLPSLLNGLPGLGPIAFPPRCVEDEARKRKIGLIGAMLRHRLAVIRGEKLCSGKAASFDQSAHEAMKWGTTVDLIHDDVFKRIMNTPNRRDKLSEFDKLFAEAISSLKQYDEIILYQDRSLIVLGCALWLRGRYVFQKVEATRVVELVQVALDTLRNQEMAHHIDPVTTPYSHLSSIHLRDSILQDEHSIPVRRRLWDKVEKIVEGNANVRATMEELDGGDVGRVWQWVGSTAISRSP